MAFQRGPPGVNVLGDEEWKIGRAQPACVQCTTPFAPGDPLQSGIFRQDVEPEYVRRDFCPSCWGTAGAQAFATWRTRLPMPEEKQERPTAPPSMLLEFLKKLLETARAEDQTLTYCLALYLARKRHLVQEGTRRREGAVWLTYSLRDEPDARIEIFEPALTEVEVERAEDSLLRLIGGGSPAPEPPAPAGEGNPPG